MIILSEFNMYQGKADSFPFAWRLLTQRLLKRLLSPRWVNSAIGLHWESWNRENILCMCPFGAAKSLSFPCVPAIRISDLEGHLVQGTKPWHLWMGGCCPEWEFGIKESPLFCQASFKNSSDHQKCLATVPILVTPWLRFLQHDAFPMYWNWLGFLGIKTR